MALKAGYYGVKKNVMDELKQLDGALIVKEVGRGLVFDPEDHLLLCKSASGSTAGVVRETDIVPALTDFGYPLVVTTDEQTSVISDIDIAFDTTPTANTGDTVNKLITSAGVYEALHAPTALYETSQNIKAVDDSFVLPDTYDKYSKIIFSMGRSNVADGFQYYELPGGIQLGQYTLVTSYQESGGTISIKHMTLQKASDNKTFTVVTSTYGSSDYGIRNVYLYK